MVGKDSEKILENTNPAIAEFVSFLRSMGRRDITIQQYETILTSLPYDVLVNNPKEINKLLFSSDKPPSRVAIETSAVRTFYRVMSRKGGIDKFRRFVELIDKPNWRSQEKKIVLTNEEIKGVMEAVLSKCENKLEWLVVSLFYQTGIRKSIIFELTPESVSIKSNMITIRAKWKGNKAKKDYVVAINNELKERLLKFIEENKIEKDKPIFRFEKWGEEWREIKHKTSLEVFRAERLKEMVRKCGNRVNTYITPHTLRHFYGKLFYEKSGRDILLTKEAMGHTTVKATERYAEPTQKIKDTHKEIFGE